MSKRSFSSMGLVLLASLALGQDWIRFRDRTTQILQLSTVTLEDSNEKDFVAADFNNDRWIDIVVVRKEPFSNPGPRSDLLLMNEKGILVDRTTTLAPQFQTNPTDARDVVATDFTGDGFADLIIANTFDQQPEFYRNLGEDQDGNWLGFTRESAARLPTITPINQPLGPKFCAVWAGDVSGDLIPDVYFSNYEPSGGTNDVLLINDGSGFFTDETSARLGNRANVAFGTSAEIHDVDNDGDSDIIKISTLYEVAPFQQGIYILYNDGSGNFSQTNFTKLPGNRPYMFSGGKLNDDNMLDFYEVDDMIDKVIFITETPPDAPVVVTSESVNSPRTSNFGGNIKFADLDGNGTLDVGVAPIDVDIANCGFSSQFALLQNPGDGRVFDPWSLGNAKNFHLDPHDFVFVDIDRDDRPDMVMGLCEGWRVFMQLDPDAVLCPADCFPDNGDGTYGDGTIDNADYMATMSDWAATGGPCDIAPFLDEDDYGDGRVGVDDMIAVLNAMGPCKP